MGRDIASQMLDFVADTQCNDAAREARWRQIGVNVGMPDAHDCYPRAIASYLVDTGWTLADLQMLMS